MSQAEAVLTGKAIPPIRRTQAEEQAVPTVVVDLPRDPAPEMVDPEGLTNPVAIARTWVRVKNQPDNNPLWFAEECRNLAIILFVAQNYLSRTGDREALRLFREFGMPVRFSLGHRLVSKVRIAVDNAFGSVKKAVSRNRTRLIIAAVLLGVGAAYFQPWLYLLSARDRAIELCQDAQSAASSASNYHLVINTVGGANKKIARYNKAFLRLPVSEREGLQLLAYKNN